MPVNAAPPDTAARCRASVPKPLYQSLPLRKCLLLVCAVASEALLVPSRSSPPSIVSGASRSPLFRRAGVRAFAPSQVVSSELRSSVVDQTFEGNAVATTPEDEGASDGGPALGAWVPIGSACALTGLGPQKIRVMGLDLVVWHVPIDEASTKKTRRTLPWKRGGKGESAATEWSVLLDACPHRLAPLSQGRVDPETGCIECPYHGWTFDKEGALNSVPQLEEERSLTSVAKRGGDATSFPVHLAGDLIFAFLPTSVHGESFPRSVLPEDMYPYLREQSDQRKAYFTRELPYSADFLIENFMDPSHIPFAHHGLQSLRDDGKPMEMKEVVTNFTHVETTFTDLSKGKARDGIVSFQRPSFYHFRTKNNDGEYEPRLCVYITPIEPGKCRVHFASFEFWFLPTWLAHAASNRFLNTDTWLHDAERTVRMGNKAEGKLGSDYVFASKADFGVAAYRKWWAEYGHKDAPPSTFGAAKPEDLAACDRFDQIDPWTNHAKTCSKCRGALRVMKKGEKISLVFAILSAVFVRGRPVRAVALAGLSLWTHFFLKKCATIIEGNPFRSGVADRSVAALKD